MEKKLWILIKRECEACVDASIEISEDKEQLIKTAKQITSHYCDEEDYEEYVEEGENGFVYDGDTIMVSVEELKLNRRIHII